MGKNTFRLEIAGQSLTTSVQVSGLKKFMVNFRRPTGYQGKYGFDWLRDEYMYPIIKVENDNDGTPIGVKKALCKNITALKTEYGTTDVKYPISPYGNDYYPSWLSIFPSTNDAQFKHGSNMHEKGVHLDLEIEELEPLVSDDTKLIFESENKFLIITPETLDLRDLIGNKQTKNLGGTTTRNYYNASKKVNVKCKGGTLSSHTDIRVFAELNGQREEVGKLIVHENNVIPKAEIVAIKVISSANKPKIKHDYQFLLKNQSFNQAGIRAEVLVDTEFDLVKLAKTEPDVQLFLDRVSGMKSEDIKRILVIFYETYGKHKPTTNYGEINYVAPTGTTRTYFFYTEFTAGNVLGSCSLDANYNWGNSYIVYNSALEDDHTIVHEAAHSLGLPHVFQRGSSAGRHTFYHGYTENYMDYVWQAGSLDANGDLLSSGSNKFKGKMYSFYKWQWEELRKDRSLISNY